MIHDMCDNSKPSDGQTREFLALSPTPSEAFVKTIFVCLLGFFVRTIGLCIPLIGTMGFLFVVVGHVGMRVCSLRQSWQRQVAALGGSSKVFRSLEQAPTSFKLSTFRDGLADKRLSFGGQSGGRALRFKASKVFPAGPSQERTRILNILVFVHGEFRTDMLESLRTVRQSREWFCVAEGLLISKA